MDQYGFLCHPFDYLLHSSAIDLFDNSTSFSLFHKSLIDVSPLQVCPELAVKSVKYSPALAGSGHTAPGNTCQVRKD